MTQAKTAKSTKSAKQTKKVAPNLPPPPPKGGNTGTKMSAKAMIGAAVAAATAAAAAVVAFRTAGGDKRKVYHLMPHEKGWQVRIVGKNRPEKTFDSKRPARDYARGLADSNQPSQLVIHRTDGTIQTVHTYGE